MTTEALWQQFREELDAFLRRQVRNAADAEDLRQQVYLQMHRHLQEHQPPRHLRGWVYRVARNAIIDHRRRRAARPDTGAADVALAEPVAASRANPEAVAGLAWCLLGMVEQLDEPYRSALRLSELEGLKQHEAAARAGVSLSGMKSRVQRGRAKLREALLACCEVELDAQQQPISHRCRNPQCGCSSRAGTTEEKSEADPSP